MAEPLEQWEQDALASGMDDAELEKRRDLEESLYLAAENALEAIRRQKTAVSLMLEGERPEEAYEKSKTAENPADSAFRDFRAEVRRALQHIDPEGMRRADALRRARPGKQKRGGRQQRGRRR